MVRNHKREKNALILLCLIRAKLNVGRNIQ